MFATEDFYHGHQLSLCDNQGFQFLFTVRTDRLYVLFSNVDHFFSSIALLFAHSVKVL